MYHKWTLEDLIEVCSDALYEYEGKNVNVSKPTVQIDIQLMRSDKLRYNALIVVYDNMINGIINMKTQIIRLTIFQLHNLI
jgi:hypothetical protein